MTYTPCPVALSCGGGASTSSGRTLGRRLRRCVVRAAGLALVGLMGVASAQAMTLREMRALSLSDKKQGDNYLRYYLVGVMEGEIEAQNSLARAGGKPQICINARRLQPSNAKTLLDAELQRHKDLYEADMPVQLVMFNALATAYPCD